MVILMLQISEMSKAYYAILHLFANDSSWRKPEDIWSSQICFITLYQLHTHVAAELKSIDKSKCMPLAFIWSLETL